MIPPLPPKHQSNQLLTHTHIGRFRDELTKLTKLKKNWDTYESPPPNKIAITNGDSFLTICEEMNVCPNRVAPISDGGVCLSFLTDSTRAAFFGTTSEYITSKDLELYLAETLKVLTCPVYSNFFKDKC